MDRVVLKIKKFILRIKHSLLVWKYEKLYPWLKKHQESYCIKFFENASWFKWYGRKVVYVKPRDPSKVKGTHKAVVECIQTGEFDKALCILDAMSVKERTSDKHRSLRQIIVAKQEKENECTGR